MINEISELKRRRHRRIRRVKRWLRPLPRRTNIHRYPLLNRFARIARKRSYLWSFRVRDAVPAIYAGCIVALLPFVGFQLVLAFLLALWLRANLPILVGIQFISNPLTLIPILLANYMVARHLLSVFGVLVPPLSRSEVVAMLNNVSSGQWGTLFERFGSVLGVTSLGALLIGLFAGLIGSTVYRIVASRTAASYLLLKKKILERKDSDSQ